MELIFLDPFSLLVSVVSACPMAGKSVQLDGQTTHIITLLPWKTRIQAFKAYMLSNSTSMYMSSICDHKNLVVPKKRRLIGHEVKNPECKEHKSPLLASKILIYTH